MTFDCGAALGMIVLFVVVGVVLVALMLFSDWLENRFYIPGTATFTVAIVIILAIIAGFAGGAA